jgi:hypothetical protein
MNPEAPFNVPECWLTPYPASLNYQDHWKCHTIEDTDSSKEFRKKYFKRINLWKTKFLFEYNHSEIANLISNVKLEEYITRSFDIWISEIVTNILFVYAKWTMGFCVFTRYMCMQVHMQKQIFTEEIKGRF